MVKKSRTYIRNIRLKGDTNNNKQERFNDEFSVREKVVRGLMSVDTPLLKGLRIYHNFIRGREGLNGQIPAEKCRIIIEGNDKWRTIIQNVR
jgi:hypothetical protein